MVHSLTYPVHVMFGFVVGIGGAAPVRGYESYLKAAREEHLNNWNLTALVGAVEHRDDVVIVAGKERLVKDVGISQDSLVEGLVENGVHVYIVGGYCDSSSTRGAIQFYDQLKVEKEKQAKKEHSAKLILGPWTHSGRRSCAEDSFPCFEQHMYADVVRHLDWKLKDKKWGNIEEEIETEPTHYWLGGTNKWRSSLQFYQDDAQYETWRLTSTPIEPASNYIESTDITKETKRTEDKEIMAHLARKLLIGSESLSSLLSATFHYKPGTALGKQNFSFALHDDTKFREASSLQTIYAPVDYEATTGIHSRWVIASHPFRIGVPLNGLRTQEPLSFVTEPFLRPISFVGSPWLSFLLDRETFSYPSAPPGCSWKMDLTIFVYLIDIHPNGAEHLVTESRALMSHRPVIAEPGTVKVGSANASRQPGTREHRKYTNLNTTRNG
eukprot:GHVP01039453.1.p2 GENE.GHVP01039453.1~~GHVP01039453.1.p2  ORF type:complete len:440 (-),score=77.87 GHVP01039453.1:1781-3100(-)